MKISKDFISGQELIQICNTYNISISQAMIDREILVFEKTREEVWDKMDRAWSIMKISATRALKEELESIGGLIGGEARKIQARGKQGKAHVCGDVMARAISYAMGVLEVNASMGLIVAAPTAGSSGVLPGSFLSIQEEMSFTDEEMIDALFNAGAIGYIIALNATISGAEGGCQAEVGAASAMAASAITQLMGGSPSQSLSAASSALSNTLGLVCDPVGGLVEAPCQQRNAMGVSNALISAEIALSGIENVVPFDEMVDVMYQIGNSMPNELKETAQGGMAIAPSVCNGCYKN